MSINMSNNWNISTDTDAYYERVASQEEIYLEETEEELRAIWISYQTSSSRNSGSTAESLDEQLNHAAEDLITGDSDDPPLSEEVVVEMLRMTQIRKNLGRI